MNTETALTNLTASNNKVDSLFQLNKITLKDIEGLDTSEREYLAATATKIVNELTGQARENFLSKIELIIPANTKNQIWEQNNFAINSAITKLMREYGFMPSKNAIATETGLCRQTVAKHLKEFKTQEEFTGQMEQFKFMTPKVLANVFKLATNGDIKAARLYFEMVGALNKQQSNTVVNAQNNYIQINNTILSQENLRHVPAEQLNQIEDIIKNYAH